MLNAFGATGDEEIVSHLSPKDGEGLRLSLRSKTPSNADIPNSDILKNFPKCRPNPRLISDVNVRRKILAIDAPSEMESRVSLATDGFLTPRGFQEDIRENVNTIPILSIKSPRLLSHRDDININDIHVRAPKPDIHDDDVPKPDINDINDDVPKPDIHVRALDIKSARFSGYLRRSQSSLSDDSHSYKISEINSSINFKNENIQDIRSDIINNNQNNDIKKEKKFGVKKMVSLPLDEIEIFEINTENDPLGMKTPRALEAERILLAGMRPQPVSSDEKIDSRSDGWKSFTSMSSAPELSVTSPSGESACEFIIESPNSMESDGSEWTSTPLSNWKSPIHPTSTPISTSKVNESSFLDDDVQPEILRREKKAYTVHVTKPIDVEDLEDLEGGVQSQPIGETRTEPSMSVGGSSSSTAYPTFKRQRPVGNLRINTSGITSPTANLRIRTDFGTPFNLRSPNATPMATPANTPGFKKGFFWNRNRRLERDLANRSDFDPNSPNATSSPETLPGSRPVSRSWDKIRGVVRSQSPEETEFTGRRTKKIMSMTFVQDKLGKNTTLFKKKEKGHCPADARGNVTLEGVVAFFKISKEDEYNGRNIAHLAAENGDVDSLAAINHSVLQPFLWTKDIMGWYAVTYACVKGKVEAARYLINEDHHDVLDPQRDWLIHHAAQEGLILMLRMYSEVGWKLDIQNEYWESTLNVIKDDAVYKEIKEIIAQERRMQRLANKITEENTVSSTSMTALEMWMRRKKEYRDPGKKVRAFHRSMSQEEWLSYFQENDEENEKVLASLRSHSRAGTSPWKSLRDRLRGRSRFR